MAAELTLCGGCGLHTLTVEGRCPNCGVSKGTGPAVLYARAPRTFDGLDDALFFVLSFLPGLVALAAALFFVASDVLFVVALALLAAPLAGRLLLGDR